jgi:predicted  nucleic acid-binding Zn-ribbon protein
MMDESGNIIYVFSQGTVNGANPYADRRVLSSGDQVNTQVAGMVSPAAGEEAEPAEPDSDQSVETKDGTETPDEDATPVEQTPEEQPDSTNKKGDDKQYKDAAVLNTGSYDIPENLDFELLAMGLTGWTATGAGKKKQKSCLDKSGFAIMQARQQERKFDRWDGTKLVGQNCISGKRSVGSIRHPLVMNKKI